jgi:hypothetical protein
LWADSAHHVWLCPPKELLATPNAELQAAGKKALITRRLAREMQANEIPRELVRVLTEIENGWSRP